MSIGKYLVEKSWIPSKEKGRFGGGREWDPKYREGIALEKRRGIMPYSVGGNGRRGMNAVGLCVCVEK